MSKKLRDMSISLTDAIYSGEIPDHILHHFACDCAERALLQMRSQSRKSLRLRLLDLFLKGKHFELRLWEALHIKRKWIENQVHEKTLDHMVALMRRTFSQATWGVKGDAAVAANCSMMKDAKDAAWCTAWYAVGVTCWLGDTDTERTWQRRHLVALLEQYNQSCLLFLSLLIHHQSALHLLMEHAYIESESVLFWK